MFSKPAILIKQAHTKGKWKWLIEGIIHVGKKGQNLKPQYYKHCNCNLGFFTACVVKNAKFVIDLALRVKVIKN